MGGLPLPRIWHALFLLTVWTYLDKSALALRLPKQEPKKAMQKFVEERLAKEYMDSWKKNEWQSMGRCNVEHVPTATATMIHRICGKGTELWKHGDRCTCIVAKAHSCHVGCSRQIKKPACPFSSCSSSSCTWGDSSNGGSALSEGHDGVCTKHCSKIVGSYRFCGVGPDYQGGGSVDCTGCDASKQPRSRGLATSITPSRGTSKPQAKKARWMECMADCYPNPSCQEMCAEGSPDCYEQCVERYTSAVEPFWDAFQSSDTRVLDYVP